MALTFNQLPLFQLTFDRPTFLLEAGRMQLIVFFLAVY